MEKEKKSTSAMRMKKMRERLKTDNPNYQMEENKRIADLKKRKRIAMNKKEKEDFKRYERDRKRLQRAKKKQNNLNISKKSPNSPYSCNATFSKAVWRTARSLPMSPRKQQAVVTGLAKRVGIRLANQMDQDLVINREQSDHLAVTSFFFRPDIVYTCPGMKDIVTIWANGKKEKLQKHYMTMFLKEAFYIFKEENPNIKIGYSKFCSLRPKNVLLLKETPADQCKCKIHENFILKLKSLSPKCTYSSEFWKNVLCDDNLDSFCWKNMCHKCSNGKLMPYPSQPEHKVIWKTWEKNSDGRLQLSVKETCLGELFECVIADLPKMMDHVNTKRIQQKEFQCDKNAANDTRILQVDFARSFSCEYQNEIQSALWSRTSVLLFTAAVFYKGECKTYLICSDCQSKDKNTVFVFIDFLYDEIIRSGGDQPNLETIWSDGPSSEFKNKFTVKMLQILSEKYNRGFAWKYFATAHGKGIIDGIGGNVKRLVRQKMMAQGEGCVVQSAKDFAELASQIVSNTHIFYVTEDHILTVISSQKPWENVVVIPGIQSLHIILCEENVITCKTNALTTGSNSNGYRTASEEEQENYFICGEWVVVTYEGKQYPGTIVQVHAHDKIEVSVMIQAGVSNNFKWPERPDSICYRRQDIVKKLSPPDVVNNRGVFKFSECF